MRRATVLYGGRAASAKRMDARQLTLDIADITDKYTDRFDDPRYYSGDDVT